MGVKAAGGLVVSEAIFNQVSPDKLNEEMKLIQEIPNESNVEQDPLAIMDFRVHNSGGSDVIINQVSFKLINIYEYTCPQCSEYVEYGYVYGILDLGSMENIGDTVSINTAQRIKPGDADRFGVIMYPNCKPCQHRDTMVIEPILRTNYGEITAKQVNVQVAAGYEKWKTLQEWSAQQK